MEWASWAGVGRAKVCWLLAARGEAARQLPACERRRVFGIVVVAMVGVMVVAMTGSLMAAMIDKMAVKTDKMAAMIDVTTAAMIDVITAATTDVTTAATTDVITAATTDNPTTATARVTSRTTPAHSEQRRHAAKQIPWEETDATGKTWSVRGSARFACVISPAALYLSAVARTTTRRRRP